MKKITLLLGLLYAIVCFFPVKSSAGWFPSINIGDATMEKLNGTVKHIIEGLKESTHTLGDQGTRNIKCFFTGAIGAALALEGIWLVHKTLNREEQEEGESSSQKQRYWIKPTIGTLFILLGLFCIIHSAEV